jgi:hypothetical protein
MVHTSTLPIFEIQNYTHTKFDSEKCREEMLKLQKLKYSTNAPHMQSGTAVQIC